MTKFFRKIRQNLLMKNKTEKYFKYAIGEITLVVIGILIALQINNWNKNRKLSNTIESLLTVFENELVNNIEESSSLIRRGYYRDSLTNRYINNKTTREDLLKNPALFLEFSTNTKQFIDDNLDELIDLEKVLPEKYAQLIPKLKELKTRIKSQRKWEKMVIEISMERKKENADQLPWLNLSDSLSIEKSIDYYLTNPFYKNKILHYNDYDLDENTWDASLINTSSVALLWTIKNLRGTENASIDSFLKKLGMIPFQEIECDGYPFEKKESINFRLNHIFYNNTDKTVFYNYVNLEGEIWNRKKRSLPPKSFNLSDFSLNTNYFIEALENDSCKKIYRRIKEDYLVIN